MKVKKTGTVYEFAIEGPIGEGSPLFLHDVRDATKIVCDFEKMTYINSIGVKNWILWTLRVPPTAQMILSKLPLMMVNQAGTVKGFMPSNAKVESFYAPFVCPSCETEVVQLLARGQNYEYASPGIQRKVKLPILQCPKCKTVMEIDVIDAKTFAFLSATA